MAAPTQADARPPVAQLVHELPGRIRVRVPARRGDSTYFHKVRETFDLCRPVLAAEGNPRTASVLIRHEGDARTIWTFAESRGLFIPERGVAAAPRILDRVIADARQIDGWFQSSSGGDLDLGTVVTAGLVGMSVYQLLCGQILAPSVTLGWYAASLMQSRTGGRRLG